MADEQEKTQAEEVEEELMKREVERAEGAGTEEKIPGAPEAEGRLVEDKNAEEEEKNRKTKKEKIGILHIYASQNNTILNLADMSGKTIARSSGGQSTKQSRLKSSPTVAMFAAKKIGEEAKEFGITNLYVRIRAQTGSLMPGSAPHAVIKSLSREGFKILSIMETTRQPRGGPKKKGGRRGRRV